MNILTIYRTFPINDTERVIIEDAKRKGYTFAKVYGKNKYALMYGQSIEYHDTLEEIKEIIKITRTK